MTSIAADHPLFGHARVFRRLQRMSLTSRLTAWYVGLLALLLLALGAALYVGATRLSSAAALGEASIEAHNLRNAFLEALTPTQAPGPLAQAVVNSRAMQDNVVVVTNADAQVVAEAPGSSQRLGVAAGALRGSADEWLGVVDGGASGPLAVSIVRLVDPASGATLGTIEVGTLVARSNRVVQMVLVVVAVGFGLVLVLAAVVGPRLTRLSLRPLRSMAQASRSLADGRLSTRVARSDVRDEVGELSRAFNAMAEQLEASFTAQQAFVADASHELRTPLTGMGGLIDVLVRVLDTQPDEARRLAGLMRREVDRMASLVDDLLVLARVETQGAAALQMHKLDLRSVARDVFEQARVLPVARGREIALRVEPSSVDVRGEPRRLHQVLLNLATNALQHAPDGGHVTLTVRRRDGRVDVQVQDDGPGIPTEHLAHVFDRFYRTDAARARIEGGYGLGLAIARAIVEAHGGAIVASNPADGGALFSVVLPAAS